MRKQDYRILLILVGTGFLRLSSGCTVDGVNWFVPVTREINDTFKGPFFSSSTENIIEPIQLIQNDGLNGGPYVEVLLSNSILTIATNDKFTSYEEVETQESMSYTINLRCTDGMQRNLVLIVNIKDTNNNDPIFLQPEQYQFNIALPVPPGFLVTNCENDIIVRDIDLTTQRIDFKLTGSDLFEISYDPSLQVPKEFKSILRTTALIRSIPEPIILTLTATDVDLTGDPARSNTTTIIINADNQFEFPYEPMFSRSFYLALYQRDNDFVLEDTIYLDQGYDDQVKFSFESDHSEYFNLVANDNKVEFNMIKPIPVQLYEKGQIYLVVKAEREHTNGATATIIVNLPEDTRLEFERAIYKGTITDNALSLTNLILGQGYEDANITVDIRSEHTFRAIVESNSIILSMDPLSEEVIRNTNFINLEIFASNNRTTATTAVTLEIIKDDYKTPLFERFVYNASYSIEQGLTIDNIILIQGFDETVSTTIEGEYFRYFNITQDGPSIKLVTSEIPEEILKEQNIVLSVVASKPRTVGAHATINIAMPLARSLVFEKDFYIGTIENKNLTLNNIILTDGYAPDINFTLIGELANHFSTNNVENIVNVVVTMELPETVVLETDIIVLTLVASGTNAVTTSTSIVVQVIKEDYRTPVFNYHIYSINYENNELSTANITLVQGFDETVTFELIGDHREFFSLETSFNSMKLALNSTIPEDIIFNEKVIILNVVARKPRTVGANAVVYITFPREMIEPTLMSFTQNVYKGWLEHGVLAVEDVILEFGYTPETTFVLSGEYSESFSLNYTSNAISVTLKSNVSLEEVERQNFITLEIEAIRERAVPATTAIVIYINETKIVSPVFDRAFYKGSYADNEGLVFEDVISLQEGFDNTVEFGLEEEYSQWFALEQSENSIILKVNTSNPVPDGISENYQHLFFTIFARKPDAVVGRAAIYIDLLRDYPSLTILRFEKQQYIGTIENGTLHLENIRLLDANVTSVEFNLTGEFSTYFTISKNVDSVTINYLTFSEEFLENNTFIVLNIDASRIDAIGGHATIVVEIVKNEAKVVIPIFEKAFYTGQYLNSSGLEFLSSIRLAQGFDETVTFDLINEDSQWFALVENAPNDLSLRIKNETINEVTGRSHLVFTVIANKPNTSFAHTAVIISLKETNDFRILQFEHINYMGRIKEQILYIEPLRLLEENILSMEFNITGDHSAYFAIAKYQNYVEINLLEASPEMIENNEFIVLSIEASEPGAISGHTTIVIEIIKDRNPNNIKPIFSETYYQGQYSNESNLIFPSPISLVQGFNETVRFELSDDDSQWFSLVELGPNNLTLTIKNDSINDIVGRSHLIFTVVAHKGNATSGRATIVISLLENSTIRILQFEQINYLGSIENRVLEIEEMRLTGGITSTTEFNITGDYALYFTISRQPESIQVNLVDVPSEIIESNDFIVLSIEASEPGAISGHTTIVIEIIKDRNPNNIKPIFSETYYQGQYSNESNLIFPSPISLVQGFNETVRFQLSDDDSQWFSLVELGPNDLTLTIKNDSINDIVGRSHLIFTVVAHKGNTTSGRATIIISLLENSNVRILQFEQINYLGSIENRVLEIEEMRLTGGITSTTEFNITGDYALYFTISRQPESIQVNLVNVPSEIIESNDFIVLSIEASEPGAISGHTTIVIEIIKDRNPNNIKPIFNETYYQGQYSNESNLIFPSSISLVQGFNETVRFELSDDDSQWFSLVELGPNNLTLTIKNDSINDIVGRSHLIFTVVAHKGNTTSGRATIVISLLENSNVRILQFEQINYLGSIENKVLEIEEMRLTGGITSTTEFNITGDYALYFTISRQPESIQVNLVDLPSEIIENNYFLILNIKAFELGSISGYTTVILSINKDQEYKNITPVFSEAYYTGQYSKDNGLSFLSVITLIQGYDESVTFLLEDSEDSRGFSLLENGFNNFTLTFNGTSSVIENRNYLLFTVIALRPNSKHGSAAIFISITGSTETIEYFDKILYNGELFNSVLSHETITLVGFNGTNILITGEHREFFEAELTNDVVKVVTTPTAVFPRDLTYTVLELQAASAKSVLLIDVSFSENPELPRVSFKTQSYFFWADVQQTGVVGKVEAAADNGEAVEYSLLITNDPILSRLAIDDNTGDIRLTEVAEKGIYNFNVIATSVSSQVRATASVLLRVDTLPECSNDVGLSPLIVIERFEEEAHYNLVILNHTEHEGCQYTLTNVFPEDQSWLYVDSNGLHTNPIDREDKSIAFMTLSQIQVELTLKCDSDEVPAFAKRSLSADDRSNLYSYDYSPNKWVLTDTILYNARRSFVNLIVKDINDNSPKFNGKENETIFVGYPVAEIEDFILPRALAELKATDADIGENAAIMYWSWEDNLAVSPNTGLVHVRNNAELENNSRLTVYAIDQNGQGNNGSIDIVVKLLNKNQIAVLTIRNAFLENETNILTSLSNAVGYEIKVLKAVVISDNYDGFTRRKRDLASDSGASLQLYVYGLLESEPVDINQLTGDINKSNVATITILRILSLEDHLDGLEICPVLERDIGLLVSTIALAVLLFIIIIAIAVWFFLKWRITRNYDRFSDRSSSTSQLTPPKIPVIEVPVRSRLNMEEIRKSEKRLQEMLEKPVENTLDNQTDETKDPKEDLDEAIVNISSDSQLPIIIQSIDKLKDNNDESDDNDEYGEMKQPRKSVVTFNENVEKIIHIEDVNGDESSEHSYEVYKF